MQIDFKLTISVIAILLSVASLIVSMRNSQFTQYVKGVELRAHLLMKLAEVRNQIEEARKFCRLIKIDAEITGDLKLYQIADREEFYDGASKKIDFLYEKTSSLDSSRGVKVYEFTFHELHDIQKRLESQKSDIENYVKNHKSILSENKNA